MEEGMDKGCTPLPTRPQRFCDPASLVFLSIDEFTRHSVHFIFQVLTVLLMREMHKAHKRRMRLKNKGKHDLGRVSTDNKNAFIPAKHVNSVNIHSLISSIPQLEQSEQSKSASP